MTVEDLKGMLDYFPPNANVLVQVTGKDGKTKNAQIDSVAELSARKVLIKPYQ